MGADAALEVYLALLQEIRLRLQEVRKATVCFAPEDGEAELRAVLPSHWKYRPQRGTDLGKRLCHAFLEAFTNGAARVAAIGSDCPSLAVADLEEAWQALDSSDVVFGPAEDGGYWLIGMRQLHSELFEAIGWSSASVLEESLARARVHNLKVTMLRRLRDIDTEPDWRAYLDSKRRGDVGAI